MGKWLVIIGAIFCLLLSAIAAHIGLWNVLFEILLIIAGFVLALAYADLGKPNLIISFLPPEKVFLGSIETFFLKLSVLNKPLKNFPFVSRNTAFSCHGSISFFDQNRKPLFDMAIRWSNNTQPIKPEINNDRVVLLADPSLVRISTYIDICPDESETLDVCFRIPNEKDANGWNSDNYFSNNSKIPNRTLLTGKYIILVKIKHNDGSIQREFSLNNPDNIAEYRLEPLSKK